MRIDRMSRRKLLAGLSGSLAVVGLAAACAPIQAPPAPTSAPPPPPAPTAPPKAAAAPTAVPAAPTAPKPTSAPAVAPPPAATAAAAAAAQPRRGGAVTMGLVYPVQTTDPHPHSPNTITWRRALFNQLVGLDARLQPTPELAESWTMASDGSALTLKLRQGVKFHNGKDFDAEAAKWNIEYAKDARSRAQTGRDLAGTEPIVKGPHELELRFASPLPQVYSLLFGVPIIEPSSDVATAVVGTGPFKLDGFAPGDELRLARNEAYWRSGTPLLDRYTVKVVPDNSSLVVNLETNSAQAIFSPPLSDARRLSEGATRVVALPGSGNYDFLINATTKPYDDKRVRQAINFAVDRKRFVDTALFGQTSPTYVVWPTSSPVYDAATDVGEFNLDKARQLLGEAGLAEGFETTLLTSSSAAAELTQLVQIVQSDLAKIGVRATIQDMEANQWATAIRGGEFQIVAHFYSFGDQDPALLFTATPFNPAANASKFSSEAYVNAVSAAQREQSVDKRLDLYRDLTRFLKDEAFVLPLANRPQLYALRANVQGFQTTALGLPDFQEAWLS